MDRPLREARRLVRAAKGRLVLGGAVMHGPRGRHEVALTFDDGPSPAHTPGVLDALRRGGARATFFLLGRHVEAHPELARAIAAEHEIGCHSFSHDREIVKRLSAFRADVARCREVFARELGVTPRFYRFPWGDRGAIAPRDVLALEQMTCVHWSASGDEALSAPQIAARLARRMEAGAILLLHDGLADGSVYPKPRDETVLALPRILDDLGRKGLRPVTLGELLAPPRPR